MGVDKNMKTLGTDEFVVGDGSLYISAERIVQKIDSTWTIFHIKFYKILKQEFEN